MSGHLLRVENVRSGYVGSRVLNELSLTLDGGEILAVIGRNGVGKTTLMRTLMGVLPTDVGDIFLNQVSIARLSADARARLGLGYVPQGRDIFPGLTVQENLRLGAINPRARVHWHSTLEHVYHVFPRLQERHAQHALTLSGGEQQMLAIGRGMMAKPRLMLLDEPTLGLSPLMAQHIFSLVQTMVEGGLTLLLAEQDVRKALQASNHAYVLENGRVVIQGGATVVASDPRVQSAYLGL